MSAWRFESPEHLQLLWLVPVLYVGVRVWQERATSRLIKKLGGEKTAPVLTASVSLAKRKWKVYLQLAALALMILAYARPQAGVGEQTVKNEGIEIVMLIDVSNSMLAEDVKPSRLEFARSELERFVDMSGGDRMGVIAFAGSAALLSPLTTDQDAIKMYLQTLDTDSVSTQGTNFEKALTVAGEAFKRGGLGGQDGDQVTRAILIASDGEDHEPGATAVAQKLAKYGIHIYTIAFGTTDGAPIPIRDEGGQLRGYKRDSTGQVIITKVTGKELEEFARVGDGAFYHASYQNDAIKSIRTDIDKLHKSQFKSGEIPIYREYFQLPLLLGFLLALFELWLGERRKIGRIWRGRFEVPQ